MIFATDFSYLLPNQKTVLVGHYCEVNEYGYTVDEETTEESESVVDSVEVDGVEENLEDES